MRGPDDDEGWVEWSLKQTVLYPAQSVIGLRDVVNGIVGDYGYGITPAAQAFETIVSLTKQIKQGEFDRKLIKDLTSVAGYWGQLPTRQAFITGEALYNLITGDEDFNILDLAFPKKK